MSQTFVPKGEFLKIHLKIKKSREIFLATFS